MIDWQWCLEQTQRRQWKNPWSMEGIVEQTAERQRGCRQSCNAASGSWWQRRGSCRHYTAERQRGCRQSCNAASGSWWQQRGSCRHWRPSTTICIAGQFTRSLATTSSAVLSHGTGKFHTTTTTAHSPLPTRLLCPGPIWSERSTWRSNWSCGTQWVQAWAQTRPFRALQPLLYKVWSVSSVWRLLS